MGESIKKNTWVTNIHENNKLYTAFECWNNKGSNLNLGFYDLDKTLSIQYLQNKLSRNQNILLKNFIWWTYVVMQFKYIKSSW